MIGAREHHDAESFDDALRGRRPRSAEIAALVRTAELVTIAASVEPSPDFVLSLRAQVMADAASVLVPSTSGPSTSRVTAPRSRTKTRRRLAGLTAAAIAAVGTVSIAATSAQALPGDMLYPVKRHVESAELALHRGDASRGSFQLSQARERLSEATSLAKNDATSAKNTALITETLTTFTDQATSGSQDLFDAYGNDGSDALIDKVNNFAAASSIDLAQLASMMPSSRPSSYDDAARTVASLVNQASQLCDTCKTADMSSLAATVDRIIKGKTTKQSATTSSTIATTTKDAPSSPSSASTLPATTPTSAGTTAPTKKPLIAPPPTTAPQNLGDVTSPLLGALLGDDNQTGLVPGLLDALTGKTN